jgi:ABC-type polysaccharide/polyol phosphate export permease
VNFLTDNVFRQMVIRSIRSDYLENITGLAWLVIQPLMLLAVYAFVFTHIFKARIDEAEAIGFVPYLAVAFWPWTAFSEAVLKASGSITQNAALIGKVAFPVEMLPLAAVTATFVMNLVGYLAVLFILQLAGTDIQWPGVLLALPVLAFLFLLACGFALMFSGLQVFVRDMAQILPPLMTFWFFTTPILYSATFLPDRFAALLQYNPMTWFVERLRALVLHGDYAPQLSDGLLVVFPIVLFGFALLLFRRFSSHFEDFL